MCLTFLAAVPAKLEVSLIPYAKRVVIPAKAGRSAKRGEHPKDGPEGVSEANHPSSLRSMDSGLRRNDDSR